MKKRKKNKKQEQKKLYLLANSLRGILTFFRYLTNLSQVVHYSHPNLIPVLAQF